jgi:hypothetical protein
MFLPAKTLIVCLLVAPQALFNAAAQTTSGVPAANPDSAPAVEAAPKAAPAEEAPVSSIILKISARVTGDDTKAALWNQDESQVTLPGQSVGVKLVGENLAVLARFTPYLRADGTLYIVAQGQIWLENSDGVHYYSAIKTVPVEFGQQISFFPLGDSGAGQSDGGRRLVLLVAATPDKAAASAPEAAPKAVQQGGAAKAAPAAPVPDESAAHGAAPQTETSRAQ